MNKKRVTVIGATGQIGTPLTKNLLVEGHHVRILTRSRGSGNEKTLAEYVKQGAEIKVCPEMGAVADVASALEGSDTLIACVPGSKQIIEEFEPVWLDAAVQAGLERFVPTEFGTHSRAIEFGDGVLFDYKKRLHDKIFESDIGWTYFYNGGIFDYFLPNLRFFDEITTFGNLDLPIYTHDIEDIGRLAALALTDNRTLNRCVQVDFNALTQHEMLALVNKYWPDYPFVFKHYSAAYITKMKDEAGDEVTTKKGAETDRERWGINSVVYVTGKLAAFTDETIRASELYPDFVCKTPESAISNPRFMFEE